MVNVCLLTGTAFSRTLRSTTSGNAPGACAGRMLITVQAGNKKSQLFLLGKKRLSILSDFSQTLIIRKVDKRHEDSSTHAGAVSDTLLAGQLDPRWKNAHKILGYCFELRKPQWGSINLIPCGKPWKSNKSVTWHNLTSAFITLTSEKVVEISCCQVMLFAPNLMSYLCMRMRLCLLGSCWSKNGLKKSMVLGPRWDNAGRCWAYIRRCRVYLGSFGNIWNTCICRCLCILSACFPHFRVVSCCTVFRSIPTTDAYATCHGKYIQDMVWSKLVRAHKHAKAHYLFGGIVNTLALINAKMFACVHIPMQVSRLACVLTLAHK